MSKVYLASDHAGFALKAELIPFLTELKYIVEDVGPYTLEPEDDYPDFVGALAECIGRDHDGWGIIIGGSGEGEAMVANRVKGVRAGVFYGGSKDIVQLLREHNDANVLSLGARFISVEEAKEACKLFLATAFSNEERHVRRLSKF